MKYILALDCEFMQPSTRTIEIGAAIFNIEGHLIDTFQTYVNPLESISPYITDLTTITNESVENAPLIAEAWEQLRTFHSKYSPIYMNPIVWGSGVRNDSSALWLESKDSAPNFMGYRVFDCKTLYQAIKIKECRDIKAGLQTACKKMNILFEGKPHTATADAIMTGKLWFELLRRIN